VYFIPIFQSILTIKYYIPKVIWSKYQYTTYLIEPAMEVVELCFDRGVAAVVVLNFVAQREGDKEVDHDLDHVRAEGDDPTFQEGVHAVGGLEINK
jgi:hypothetical protein